MLFAGGRVCNLIWSYGCFRFIYPEGMDCVAIRTAQRALVLRSGYVVTRVGDKRFQHFSTISLFFHKKALSFTNSSAGTGKQEVQKCKDSQKSLYKKGQKTCNSRTERPCKIHRCKPSRTRRSMLHFVDIKGVYCLFQTQNHERYSFLNGIKSRLENNRRL